MRLALYLIFRHRQTPISPRSLRGGGCAVTTELRDDNRGSTLNALVEKPLIDVERTGRIFGWLFIATFVTSIPARLLFIHGVHASWSDMHFVPGDTSTASLK